MYFSGLRQPQNNVNRDGDEICEDDIQSYLPIITAKRRNQSPCMTLEHGMQEDSSIARDTLTTKKLQKLKKFTLQKKKYSKFLFGFFNSYRVFYVKIILQSFRTYIILIIFLISKFRQQPILRYKQFSIITSN